MIISNFLFYIISGVLFLFYFFANITTSQAKHQWMSALSYCILAIVYSIILFTDYLDNPSALTNLCIFSIALFSAMILAQLFRLRQKIAYKAKKPFGWLFYTIGLFVVTFFAITPILINSASDKTLIDKTIQWIFGATVFILYVVFIIQPPTPTIYQNGILYKGAFWGWKDIHEYKFFEKGLDKSLISVAFPNEEFFTELIFYPKKMPFWNPKQFEFFIPEQKINFLSVFVEQNAPKPKNGLEV